MLLPLSGHKPFENLYLSYMSQYGKNKVTTDFKMSPHLASIALHPITLLLTCQLLGGQL